MNLLKGPIFDSENFFTVFCPICDAVVLSKQIPVCRFCYRLIQSEIHRPVQITRLVEGIPVYSLFRWKSGESLGVIPELLYLLKGGGQQTLVRHLVHLFLVKNQLSHKGPRIFVPAPAKVFSDRDHALALAEEFQRGQPQSLIFTPLVRRQGEQKTKDLAERKRSKMDFTKNRIRRYRSFRDRGQVIFVDDVVTSGSTLLTAWKTLGKPKDFQCWCLVDRALG